MYARHIPASGAPVVPRIIEIVSATVKGETMGDFLIGARWGGWLVLAGIVVVGLRAFVH